MNENIRLDESTVFNPQTGEFGSLPQILLFSTDKNILIDETPATVSWTVSNATVIKLNNEVVEPTGTKEFHTGEPLTLTLSASNDVGAAEPKAITIDIDRRVPVIHFFKTNVPVAIKGSPVVLNWNVEGAYKIEIGGIGIVPSTSSKTITLGDNGVFTLIAKNYFGIPTEATAAVTVFPTPILERLIVPIPDFNRKLNLNPLQIASPVIDVSIKQSFSITRPNFTKQSFDLQTTRAMHKPKYSYFNLSEVFHRIKKSLRSTT